jgi:hypothetical protein
MTNITKIYFKLLLQQSLLITLLLKCKKSAEADFLHVVKHNLFAHYHSHGFHFTVLDHLYHVNASSQCLTKVDSSIQ